MFKLSFKQQVLTGFGISLFFVLVSAVSSYLSINKLNNDTRWQTHTYEVIDIIKDVETQVINSETGMRGYVLSGNRSFLAPYTKQSPKILPTILKLRNTVADNPGQKARIDSLEFYAQAKIREMHDVLTIYATEGREFATFKVMDGSGQFYSAKILEFAKQLSQVERSLLTKRKDATLRSSTQSEVIVLVSACIIFCLILFLFSYIKKTFDQQKETEEKVRTSNSQLEKLSIENEQKNWLLSGASKVNTAMRGEQDQEELTANVLAIICQYIKASVGAIYVLDPERNTYKFSSGYSYLEQKNAKQEYRLGEGLVGQAGQDHKIMVVNDIPADYIKVASGLGAANPTTLWVIPVPFKDTTLAVIELGLVGTPHPSALTFLTTISESVGVGLNSSIAREQLRSLYEQTQQQAEELESQQEELRTTNEELVYKSEQLIASEEELRVQQEELRETNAELEEKAKELEERNILVNQAREAMVLKAEELEISSRYKSEFLANMSHELRTPLNSILILARILKENKPQNLNEEQVKYAGVIQNAGTDLLTLINDILDLSKIESGKIDLLLEDIRPQSITSHMESLFGELARSKKIRFRTVLDPSLPTTFNTDQTRVEQIVKNLLSNAFKFTPENGEITLSFNLAGRNNQLLPEQLQKTSGEIISISVQDSGIGIPEDKQNLIFEAFQQADGSTSRKYGGTGLGLSISKELAHILGGEIQIESKSGEGSKFTLLIPVQNIKESTKEEVEKVDFSPVISAPKAPDREGSSVRKQTLLIVEDDVQFAEILKDYAIGKGFAVLVAHQGDTGLEMARLEKPDDIILDIMLPVIDGWTILKKLKSDPLTKHIPVHMMSAGNENNGKAKREGAIGVLSKPVGKHELDQAFESLQIAYDKYQFRKALVIEDQEFQSTILSQQLTERGVEVKQAFTGQMALQLLEDFTFDCIILDLTLPDISGFDLLDRIKSRAEWNSIPVIINTAMELDDDKMAHILKHTDATILKSDKSNDRLIDEVSLFINKIKNPISAPEKTSNSNGTRFTTLEDALRGKTILIADDDMRNIFALSSALQDYDIQIEIANNGRQALEKLKEKPAIDLVLMDIMMPEMDGYEAMKAIRSEQQHAKLPIIALTAKAMKNDREKCIAAGANDYISKPVDVDKLVSMMRVWLS